VLRYLAMATAIVLGCLLVVVNLPRQPSGRGMGYSSGHGTPGPFQRDDFVRSPEPVSGEAPWALSALPECFRQLSSTSGSPAFARAALPARAERLAAGTRLQVADCTLQIGRDSAVVVRGENRLVVPPLARFYHTANRLILERVAGGREDVRVYAPAPAKLPRSQAYSER